MKKIYTLFALAALFSCTQELDPVVPESPTKDDPEVVDPENNDPDETNPTVPEGMISLTFTVSSEKDAKTKTHLGEKDSNDEYEIIWDEGDEIRIIWGTGESDYVDAEVEDEDGDGVYTVTADVSASAETLYAVYPTTGAFALREGGTIDFGIPINQDGTFKSANMMAAVTSKDAANFAFKNLTHIFKFHLTGDSPYDRFQFCTNNSNRVVGTYGVSFNNDGTVSIGKCTEEISGLDDSIYVRLHNGMVPGGDYYFAVVPGANYNLGFGLQARISGQSGSYTVAALSKGAVDTSSRVNITDLKNLDTFIHADWFITEDGTGDGTSWGNPGGPALLRSLLVMPAKFNVNEARINHTTRLNNAKIHLKQGTYNFQTILADSGQHQFGASSFNSGVDNVTVIYGGYPSGATGKDLTGYNPHKYPTVVISNQAADNDRALYFNGARLYDWTFKGLSFKNNPAATNYNTPGGAVAINGGTNGTIKFEDCSFTLTTSNTSGGGALSFRGTAEVNAEFKNCTFSGCQATSGYGGGIWINTTYHNLTFDGCTISRNTASKGGGFLYNQNSGKVIFKNKTTLENNVANSTTLGGGAIYASGSGTIELDDTTLSGNQAPDGNGGAISNLGTLTLTNCTLTANDCAANGGAIYNEGNLTLNGTTITGKGKDTNMTALLGGGIYNKGGATATIKNNSVIEGCAITGSSHHGAAIWNGGALTIDGSILQNNINTQRGGGIYCVGTEASASVSNTLFDDDDAANGGAIALDDGASAYIIGCTFTSCNATNGAAIRTVNNGTNTSNSKALVFNSLFESNTSTGGRNDGGGITQSAGYGRILIANSTFKDNTTNQANGVISYNLGNCKTYVISDTFNGNTSDVTSGSSNIVVRNSLLMASAIIPEKVNTSYCIWKTTLIDKDKNTSTLDGFALGKYVADKGVYILDDTYYSSYSLGMDVSELSNLSFNGITLTDDQKTLLAKDQKGNDRVHDTTNCKYMGAYVGEWWSNE